ncbi:MAG: FAD-binding oxidoreductase [Clostridia bacterium]|nr:FAD-binding oxidoreductase [Clostridia bacterium]
MSLVNQLREIIGEAARVLPGEEIEEQYLTDTLGRLKGEADALVFALSTEEVSRVMKFAHENGIPVTPRGAGTNLVGSTVPTRRGIILDLSRMNRILEVDEETFTAVVEPGVILQEFQAYVESLGLFYPPDPGEKTASIGGNIATNAGGMRAVKYGVTRDYVRGLEVVLADGTVITSGSKNVKDASGLQLRQLFVGSEGTLCVITKCILRLVPKPEKSLSVFLAYPDLKSGIQSVHAIIKANAGPTAIEFIERSVVELGEKFTGGTFPCPEAKAYILLTFDGNAEQVQQNAQRIQSVAEKTGAMAYIPLTDPAQAAEIWKVRGCFVKAVEAVSEQEPVDLVVPINQTAAYIDYVHQVEAETGMHMIAFGHAGDGNVHLCIIRGDRDEETWKTELNEVMHLLYRRAHELGGLTSGEHGVGIAKQPYFFRNADPLLLQTMRSIKDALDPDHILNDHISYLK